MTKTRKLVLVRGGLHVGKSTVVRSVMSRLQLPLNEVRGYQTRSFHDVANRVFGHELVGWHSETSHQFARRSDHCNEMQDYTLDQSVFNGPAVRLLQGRSPWLIVDELGRFELPAITFISALKREVAVASQVMLVIQNRAVDPWSGWLPLNSFTSFEVNEENRDEMPDQILHVLQPLKSHP